MITADIIIINRNADARRYMHGCTGSSGFVNKCATHALLPPPQANVVVFSVVLRCGLEILIPTLEPCFVVFSVFFLGDDSLNENVFLKDLKEVSCHHSSASGGVGFW